MDSLLIALVVAALTLGGLLLAVIFFTSHRHKTLNKELYQKVWQNITQIDVSQVDGRTMAIVKADSLVDRAMRDSGVSGATMGERLKARTGRWTDERGVWLAHKLRNKIAHESYQVSEKMHRQAMKSFEQALKDLGAL